MNRQHPQPPDSPLPVARGDGKTVEQINRDLDQALEATFPASDPLEITMPHPAAGKADKTST